MKTSLSVIRMVSKKLQEGQLRRRSEPYWKHTFRVAEVVSRLTPKQEILVAALLYRLTEHCKHEGKAISSSMLMELCGDVWAVKIVEDVRRLSIEMLAKGVSPATLVMFAICVDNATLQPGDVPYPDMSEDLAEDREHATLLGVQIVREYPELVWQVNALLTSIGCQSILVNKVEGIYDPVWWDAYL